MRSILAVTPFLLLAMMVWAAQTVAPAGAPAVGGGAGRIAPMQAPAPIQPVRPVQPMPNYPQAVMSNEMQQRFYFTNNFHELTNRTPGFMPAPQQNTMPQTPPGFQTNGMTPANPPAP